MRKDGDNERRGLEKLGKTNRYIIVMMSIGEEVSAGQVLELCRGSVA
jgi:hypothetical protein